MTDRAVPGDKNNWSGCYMCPHCDEIQIKTCQKCGELIDFSKPRSLVALSEDGQWLVVQVSHVGMFRAFGFGIYKSDGRDYVWQESVLGTGQSAEDALEDFLAVQEATDD